MLSKKMSNLIRGIALIMLMIHHLFTFPDDLINVSYISLFKISTPIEQFLGYYCSICIYIFIFITGHGFYVSSLNKNIDFSYCFNKVLKVYFKHVVVFTLFIGFGLLFFNKEVSLYKFLQDLFLIKLNYNDSLWFLRPYLIIVLFTPLLLKLINKSNKYLFLIVIILLSFVYYYLYEYRRININSFTVYFKFVLQLLPSYLLGVYFAKNKLFEYFNINNKFYVFISFIVFIFSICLYVFYSPYFTLFYVVSLVVFLYMFFSNFTYFNKYIEVLGENSLNIWLVHNFIIFDYFMNIVFLPKISILIVFWILLICLFISKIIDFLFKGVSL